MMRPDPMAPYRQAAAFLAFANLTSFELQRLSTLGRSVVSAPCRSKETRRSMADTYYSRVHQRSAEERLGVF